MKKCYHNVMLKDSMCHSKPVFCIESVELHVRSTPDQSVGCI